jgi:hypothetical protein
VLNQNPQEQEEQIWGLLGVPGLLSKPYGSGTSLFTMVHVADFVLVEFVMEDQLIWTLDPDETDFCWKMINPSACQTRLLNKIKSGTGKSIDLTPSTKPWLFELLVNNHRGRIVQPPKKWAPKGVWWGKMRLGDQYRKYEVGRILNGMKILHLGRSLAKEKSAARGIARDAGLNEKTSAEPAEINKLREVMRFPQTLDDGFYQMIFTYSWKYKPRGSSSSVHDLLG